MGGELVNDESEAAISEKRLAPGCLLSSDVNQKHPACRSYILDCTHCKFRELDGLSPTTQ